LIAVTAPELHEGQNVLDACRAAVGGGATAVQIRAKHRTAADLCRTTEQIMRIVEVPVYVNDRLDVALAAGAHGVHLGAADLPPGRVRAIVPSRLRLGLSVGDRTEAREAIDAPAHYWSIGPFASTMSKADAGPALGAEGFRTLSQLAPEGVPVIGIGGIDAENVSDIVSAGARGVAIISAIFGADDIEGATRRIRDVLDASLLDVATP
jgi:thiamine-phosphate pyrophosphorylase